ncbi:MAG: hypothetical protein ACREJL_07475 [Candidatus Methylomirabilales bacterium]
MTSRGLTHAIRAGAFLAGLVLALPGPAAATGFIHAQQHVPFTHAFQHPGFGHFGHHQPHVFRDHRGFHRRDHPHFHHHHHGFRHHQGGFHHNNFRHGGFRPHDFHHGSRTFFFWR